MTGTGGAADDVTFQEFAMHSEDSLWTTTLRGLAIDGCQHTLAELQPATSSQHRWVQGLLCRLLLSCSPGRWRVQVKAGLAHAIHPPLPIAAPKQLELLER
jgi:hypothetical protein